AGGGRVVVPPGEWLTGAIQLKSNVNLHVSQGATLRWIFDLTKYPTVFTRWEGVECMNYSAFIYAFEQENIAITGTGTLDGGADWDTWWGWCKRSWEKSSGEERQNRDPRSFIKTGDPLQKPARDRLNAQGEAGTPVAERIY